MPKAGRYACEHVFIKTRTRRSKKYDNRNGKIFYNEFPSTDYWGILLLICILLMHISAERRKAIRENTIKKYTAEAVYKKRIASTVAK